MALKLSYDASNMKHLNRKSVLNIIRSQRAVTRSHTSRLTGISAPTMLKIFDHFTGIGIVEEHGEDASTMGRKANLYIFNPDSFYALGVDIIAGRVSVGLVNLDYQVYGLNEYAFEADFLTIFHEYLPRILDEYISNSGIPREKLLGVGIGCPTTVANGNTIPFAPLMGIYESTSMTASINSLQDRLNLPVLIENDTNAAAMGEFHNTQSAEENSLAFISLRRGLGAGFVLDGRLWRGSQSLAGEIGYMTFDEGFSTNVATPGWMEKRMIESVSLLSDIEDANIITICQQADPSVSRAVIDSLSGDLALVIANISAILDVSNFVIGGAVCNILGQPLVDALYRKLNKLTLTHISLRGESSQNPVIAGMGGIVCEKNIQSIIE